MRDFPESAPALLDLRLACVIVPSITDKIADEA